MDRNVYRVNKFVEKLYIYGIVFILLLGTLNHFLYDLIPSEVVAIFVPVNESVWEHLKLVIWPAIIYLVATYLIFKPKKDINLKKYFYFGFAAIYLSCTIILIIYYLVLGMFGFNHMIIDIFAYFMGAVISQTLAAKNYTNNTVSRSSFNFIMYTTLILIFCVIAFTFYPPHLPLFFDEVHKVYGINRR